jgi:2,4-dienoyl-CoA reductase (NADPH2)
MMFNPSNQFVFAPIKLGYCINKDGKVNDKHINFYTPRSRHTGTLIYEPLYIDSGLRELPTQLGIDNDDKIDGLKKLNEKVQKNGAWAVAHLNHPGRQSHPKLPGNYHVSSTDIPCENDGAIPKMMDRQDMNSALDLLKNAAIRAEKANFNAIELQLGHGYLAAQFLSPHVNRRNDEYGGALENRMRFPLEMFDVVRKNVSIPVIVRITGSELCDDGITLEESITFVNKLKEKGADVFHVVAGSGCSSAPWFFQHMFTAKGKTWELAKKIKDATGVRIISVGRITSIMDIEHLLERMGSDFIGIGRALIADPDFVGKYTGEIDGNIKPCMSCSDGCLGGVRSGKGLGCMVNPVIGNEPILINQTQKPKNIAVVGGGLAGMEFAIQAKERGHNITIFEKEILGGQFNLAWLPPKKGDFKQLLDYYKLEISDKNIRVIYKEADKFDLLNGEFDEIVLATGAVPLTPPIKGLNKFFWSEFLDDDSLPKNKRIVIIGGGLIGIEVASKLVENGNKVIIVEMADEVARGMEILEKKQTLTKLRKFETKIYTGYKVSEVKNGNSTVIIEGDSTIQLNNINHIVMTTGMKSNTKIESEIKGRKPYYKIGDAVKPAKALNAIADGFKLGIEI